MYTYTHTYMCTCVCARVRVCVCVYSLSQNFLLEKGTLRGQVQTTRNSCLIIQPTSVVNKAGMLGSISSSSNTMGIIYIFIECGCRVST